MNECLKARQRSSKSERGLRGAGLARPRGAPTTAGKIIAAGVFLLATACGGSAGGRVAQLGSTTTRTKSSSNLPATSAREEGSLAFSRCMRSHGVPEFPDASSSNEMPSGLPKVSAQELGVSGPQFQAAENDCRHLLPNGGQAAASALRQTLEGLVAFARCMRSHGVQNWPGPIPVSAQAPPGAPPYTFDLQGLPGLDARSFSPQINSAMNACFHLTHLTDAEVPWSG